MACTDKKKFVTSEASSKASLRTKGAIDEYLNIKDTNLFRKLNKKWSEYARNKFNVKGNLFLEENDKAIPNRLVFRQIDKAKGIVYKQKVGTETKPASPKTIAALKDFTKRIGVDVKNVKDIVIDGIRQDANGAAIMMQKLIQVVEGKESQALPEEAMHFAVEIIEQKNPKLFNQLLKEITDYTIYNEVLVDYSDDPNYQTPEGKPDIRKLKKEAIGKVLAEVIINQSEGLIEHPEKIAKVETWWSKIVDYLRNLFTTSGFDQTSMDILSGKNIGTAEDIVDGGVYLQKTEQTKQEQIYNSIKEIASKIKKEDDGYSIDGKKINRRVSDIVSDWYKRRLGEGSLTNDEFTNTVNDLKATKGTAGHADLEHAFEIFVDENGKLRKEILNDDGYVSQLNPNDRTMYDLLKKNLQARLATFDKETIFMSEATLYDAKRDMAGTVDFLAITPEGKVSILDWKFMDLNTDKYEDIPWYKINAWNIQMEQYKYMISRVYNVKNENFEQTRMIPIKAVYSEANRKTGAMPQLLSIKIGDVNVKNIEEDYLIPVGLESEKTGNKEIDELLEKLNGTYKKLSAEKVLPSEKINKAEQLNALFSAIRQLQMKQNIAPLLYQAKILNKQIEATIDIYNDKFKDEDKSKFTEAEISEFANTLEVIQQALDTYINLDSDLEFLFERELSDEDKKLKEDLRDTVYNARKYKKLLINVDKEYIQNIIGGSVTAEKIVKGITRLFGNTATIQLKALEVLFKKSNKAYALAGMDVQTEVKKLNTIKDSFEKWASAKGYGIKNQFDLLKKKESNELIDEFNPTFYSTLKQKIKDKDISWIKDNVDVEAYRKYLEEKREEEYRRIDDKAAYRVGTEEQINKDVAREKSKVSDLYNILSDRSVGWLLENDVKKFPKRETWESAEWKQLNKPENAPAKEFYDYIKERNQYYQSIGYINAADARTFLPWVRKSFTEKLIFGGNVTIGEQFLRNISVDEGDTGYGAIDPNTGKPIDTIPRYLTGKLTGEVSTDLFKTMAMYNEFAIKFKYLTDIEAQARALGRLERNKKAIATSYFGKTEYKDNIIQYNPDNTENTKLVEDMMKAIIYQQQYIQSDSFDQVLGTFGKLGERINKKLGMNLLPENLEGRQVSVNKVITQLNNSFQVMTLGLNPLSSMSNLFGGKTQSFINSGKYFTKTDFVNTEMWLLGNKMGGADKQKALAALDYFIPFTDNYNRHAARKLSLNKLNDEAIQDFLMVMMRSGEESVQTTNFFSFIKNSIVLNGEVINTREYLKSTDEYKDFYKGTQSERDARAAKFEEDVKALNEEKGVLNLGKVVDGEFVIPGVERKSDSVVELRRKVQQFTSDALGNLTEENKRMINLNVYGKSFMVFKNWIPRLVDVRMGNVKYNAASDAYEWGRTRMFVRVISEDFWGSIGNLINTLQGNDKGMEFVRELYDKKKADYETDTNKEFQMTEAEFTDLVKQNLKNQIIDFLFYAGLFALYLGVKALAPDDEEDPAVRNQHKFALKAIDKLKDEIGYFYDPTSLSTLASGGFPSITLLTNYRKALSSFLVENYAIAIGDEKLEEKNEVIKYWMKSFKVTNQMAALLPLFSPELAKDLGIRMQSKFGVR